MLSRRLILIPAVVFVVLSGCATLFVDTENLSSGGPASANEAGGSSSDGSGADASVTSDALVAREDATLSGDASSYREQVLLDGPALYYRLAEAGDTAQNEVAGGPNATYQGAISRNAPGLIHNDVNGAARFENSGVIKIDSAALDLTGRNVVTVEMWIKPTAVVTDYRYPFMKEFNGSGRRGVALILKDDFIAFERYAGGTGEFATKYGTVVGEIMHAVGIYDGQSVRLYINSELAEAVTDQQPIALPISEPIMLGSDNGNGDTGSVLATIDEVAVYNKVLSLDRIQAHYELGRAR